MSEEKSTIVGQSITIKGEISGDQDLILHGRVEGQINLTRDLIIKQPSQTNAHVKARNVHVSGRLEGNVEAQEKVELAAEGRMLGDINAPRVVIVDGAFFKGSVDMGEESNRPQPKPNEVGPVPAVSESEKPDAEEEEAERSGSRSKDRRMTMPDYLLGKKK